MQSIDTSPSFDMKERPHELPLLILGVLWRKRNVLGLFLLAGALLTVVIALLIPNQYESTVQLMPPGWTGSNSHLSAPFSAITLPGASGAASLAAGGLLNSRSPSGPLIGILESRTMQDSLISRFNLKQVYDERYDLDVRKVLKRRTSISEDKPTGILSIVVTDRNATRARDMAAAYVEELNKLVVEMDTSSAHKERLFLESRLKDVQESLKASEQELSHYSSKTGTTDQTAQAKAMLDSIAVVQGQMIAAQAQLHVLQTTYTDADPQVQQQKARVSALAAELQKLEGGQGKDPGAESGSAMPSLRQLPLLGATYADLYRNTKTLEVAYELLYRELEAAKIQEAEEMPSIKVLDPPVVAQKKSFPPRGLFVTLGAVLGILCGALWVVVNEVWLRAGEDNPLKTLLSGEISSLTALLDSGTGSCS